MDKHNPSGFTMVEVILFFAISAALMVGIVSGVGRSISRQRYNDTVNDFAEYLRSVYTEVQSVSNDPGTDDAGRTANAIYGKLLQFSSTPQGITTVNSYIVRGLAFNASFSSLSKFKNTAGNPCSDNVDQSILFQCLQMSTTPDNTSSAYRLVWDGKAETASGSLYTGCVLIYRSPLTGVIQTSAVAPCNDPAAALTDPATTFDTTNNIDFCVQSDDNPNSRRRNVRIKANSANSSGIVIPELDSGSNQC